jgi:hypothetical protein
MHGQLAIEDGRRQAGGRRGDFWKFVVAAAAVARA